MVGRGYGDDVDGDVVEMTTMVVMLSSDDGCGVVVAVMGGSWKWRWWLVGIKVMYGAVGEADEVMRMMIWWLAEKSVVAGIISGGGAGSGERRGR
ncbi:hypothetical protein Tco_0301308 [Tanacetum coccineum]